MPVARSVRRVLAVAAVALAALGAKLGYDALTRSRRDALPRVTVRVDCGSDRARELEVTGDLRLDDTLCGAPWQALELEAVPRTELLRPVSGREVWLRRAPDRAYAEVRMSGQPASTIDHVSSIVWYGTAEHEVPSLEISVDGATRKWNVDELRHRFTAAGSAEGGRDASLCKLADELAGKPAHIEVTGETSAPVVIDRSECETRGLVLRFSSRGGIRLRDRDGTKILQDVHRIEM